MDIFQLNAGKTKTSVIPVNLNKITFSKTIIEWQIDILKSVFDKFIFSVLTSFETTLFKNINKELNLINIKNFNQNNILGTFLNIPFNNKPLICFYSDTIFRKEIFKEIVTFNEDFIFTVDSNWKKRFEGRPLDDINNAEKIKIRFKDSLLDEVEFCGLIFLNTKVTKYLKKNKNLIKGQNLIDLINHLSNVGFTSKYLDVKDNWSELNYPNDLSKFILGTKSQTLRRLENIIKKSKIGSQLSFTVDHWMQNQNQIVNKIINNFKKNVIIRSSSLQEDGWMSSNAGNYLSVPNIPPEKMSLVKRIDEVINSYDKQDININEVFIQEHITNVKISGVIFTCGLGNGVPYYYVNFDENTQSTNSVTSGSSNELRNIIVLRSKFRHLKYYDKNLFNLVVSIKEIEKKLFFNKLDIEFAIDKKNQIHIFQTRPIITKDTFIKNDISKIDKIVNYNIQKYNRFLKNKNIKRLYFSNMTDWNPAEMIGFKPKPLAFSLYKYLITDNIWSKQRFEAGFEDLQHFKLLKNFCGSPYVDIYSCFKSFIPRNLPSKIKDKLLNAYLDIFKKNPQLHDKVEFEIVFTCWIPNFCEQAKRRLLIYNFTNQEILIIEKELIAITIRAIKDLYIYIEKFKKLAVKRNNIISDNDFYIIKKLLSDCKNFGFHPFAHIARSAFISVNFIKYIRNNKIFAKHRIDELYSSLNTITNEFNYDMHQFKKKNKDFDSIVSKYGHLRPGTYEITSEAYWENLDYFKHSQKNIDYKNLKLFKINKGEKKRFNEAFKKLLQDINCDIVMDFIIQSIKYREKIKFDFSKNISLSLDKINILGKKYDINRKNLSYLKLSDLKKDFKIKNILKIIKIRKEIYNKNALIEMPHIILSQKDFYLFEHYFSIPNFVTNKKTQGQIVEIKDINDLVNLNNKIALIEFADPGFDWIFNHNIKGLITMYGGANSHMAIRSSELSLPAAIGVGLKRYKELLKSKYIELDTLNKRIIDIL